MLYTQVNRIPKIHLCKKRKAPPAQPLQMTPPTADSGQGKVQANSSV